MKRLLPALLVMMLGALPLAGCADLQALAKCGPNGSVDWDPNPDSAPPHCNG
jgi:hypothetical protein